jgi:hypothetical protein
MVVKYPQKVFYGQSIYAWQIIVGAIWRFALEAGFDFVSYIFEIVSNRHLKYLFYAIKLIISVLKPEMKTRVKKDIYF